jgi:hypothetical protein
MTLADRWTGVVCVLYTTAGCEQDLVHIFGNKPGVLTWEWRPGVVIIPGLIIRVRVVHRCHNRCIASHLCQYPGPPPPQQQQQPLSLRQGGYKYIDVVYVVYLGWQIAPSFIVWVTGSQLYTGAQIHKLWRSNSIFNLCSAHSILFQIPRSIGLRGSYSGSASLTCRSRTRDPIPYPWAFSADPVPGLVKLNWSGSAHRLECLCISFVSCLWILLCCWVSLYILRYRYILISLFSNFLCDLIFQRLPTACSLCHATYYIFSILYRCTYFVLSWAFYISFIWTLKSVFSVSKTFSCNIVKLVLSLQQAHSFDFRLFFANSVLSWFCLVYISYTCSIGELWGGQRKWITCNKCTFAFTHPFKV